MHIEILGSGGATTIPRPFCSCATCQEAKIKGVPYSRSGPAYFIHDVKLLIDTPEDIGAMIVRSDIRRVDAVIYSHWHPDHTLGIRIWESNMSLWDWPPKSNPTHVYLPQQVAADFKSYYGLWESIQYQHSKGYLEPTVIDDGTTIQIDHLTITPFRVAEDYVYAFLMTDGNVNVLIAPDELHNWTPPDWLPPLDFAIMPSGLFEFDPFTGERMIAEDHPVLQFEATFKDTLGMIRKMKPTRTILGHLDEGCGLSYEDYCRLEQALAADFPELGQVEFAYDQMHINVGQ